MIVQAARIKMRRNDGGIFPAKQLFHQFQPDPVRQLRRQFPLGKTLHQMIALYTVHLIPPLLIGQHILKGCFQCTADGTFEYITFCFLPVVGIVHSLLQR